MNTNRPPRLQEIILLDYCPCCHHATNRRAIDLRLAGLLQALGEQQRIFALADHEGHEGTEVLGELHICPICLVASAEGDMSPAAEDHSAAVYRALAQE